MAYPAWRDAIVVHAKAAALAVDPKWSDVAVGLRSPDRRCVRIYYGGEVAPPGFSIDGDSRVLNGQMVGERVYITAFWPLASIGTSEYAVVDDEMHAWKDELRTRLQGDSTLGAACAGLDVEYAQPDVDIFGNARYALLVSEVLVSYTEYALAQ